MPSIAHVASTRSLPDGGIYASGALPLPARPLRAGLPGSALLQPGQAPEQGAILDANDDVTSRGPLFKKAWAERYKSRIEYRPSHKAVGVDAATNTLKFEFHDDVKAAVLNVIPERAPVTLRS